MLSLRRTLPSKIIENVYHFSTTATKKVKVCLVGASGGIGQPLALLLRQSRLVDNLRLYDIVHVPGVTADLSHINTGSCVQGYGQGELCNALEDRDIVVVTAGVPRKPGMSRDDLFNVNATICYEIAKMCAEKCPKALIAIVTNPLNSVVPIVAGVLEKKCVFDPNRLFGVTTLDVVRASTFVGSIKNLDPRKVKVPVIGGHAGLTIMPILSKTEPKTCFTDEEVHALVPRIQEAGTEVVKAKAGAGSATLSMAFAAARFTLALARAIKGEKGIVECAYVSSGCTEAAFFATPLVLGKCGIEKNLGLPDLNCFEREMVAKGLPELMKNIQKAQKFLHEMACKEKSN